MAIATKAAVNTPVMLGVRRRRGGGAGVGETGGDEVMRPSISRALGARDKSVRRRGRLAALRPARYARRRPRHRAALSCPTSPNSPTSWRRYGPRDGEVG